MLNQNILIAANDYVQNGLCLTPSLFVSGFGTDKYKNKKMWEFSRFVGKTVATTYTVEDLGSTKIIRLFACIKHNMGNLAKWRIRAADSEANLTAAPVYDSGWVYVTAYATTFGTENWGEFDWGVQAGYEESEGLNRCAYLPPANDVAARFVRYDFDDTADINAREDSYIQFARLWASTGYQPSLNMQYGAEIFLDDSTDEEESRNKTSHFSPLVVKQRRLVAGFNDLPKNELLKNVLGTLFMQVGKSGEIIALMAPLEPEFYAFEGIYGHLAQTDSAKYSFYNRMTSSLHIKESV